MFYFVRSCAVLNVSYTEITRLNMKPFCFITSKQFNFAYYYGLYCYSNVLVWINKIMCNVPYGDYFL
jgi:hypothetical protein